MLYLDLMSVWIANAFQHFMFCIFFFLDQHLLHCSWDMSSANRQMNSIFIYEQ